MFCKAPKALRDKNVLFQNYLRSIQDKHLRLSFKLAKRRQITRQIAISYIIKAICYQLFNEWIHFKRINVCNQLRVRGKAYITLDITVIKSLYARTVLYSYYSVAIKDKNNKNSCPIIYTFKNSSLLFSYASAACLSSSFSS